MCLTNFLDLLGSLRIDWFERIDQRIRKDRKWWITTWFQIWKQIHLQNSMEAVKKNCYESKEHWTDKGKISWGALHII